MQRRYLLPVLAFLILLFSGALTAIYYHPDKLYFRGDGGGTDVLIIYKTMLFTLAAICTLVGIHTARKLYIKQVFIKVATHLSAGISVTIVAGTFFTWVGYHSACDEYGRNSAACLVDDSPSFLK